MGGGEEEVRKMQRALGKRGQSILEYLVIVVVVIAAVIAIRAVMGTSMNGIYTNAATLTGNAGTALSGIKLE